MDLLDEIMQSVMAIDAEKTPESVSEGGKASYPEYPGEIPKKADLIKWLDSYGDSLITNGHGAMMRGQVPYTLARLAPRPLLTVPASTADNAAKVMAIVSENERIKHTNETNKTELHGRKLEYMNTVAAKLKIAMRTTAPIKLKKLLAAHPAKDELGADIPDAYDGYGMFADLELERAGDVSEYDEKRYQRAYESLRDSQLADNCSPQEFSKRINMFTVHVNPYLEIPLTDARLGRFVLSQLPDCLASEMRALKRVLEKDDELKLPTKVISECLTLVEDAYQPTKKQTPVGVWPLRLALVMATRW